MKACRLSPMKHAKLASVCVVLMVFCMSQAANAIRMSEHQRLVDAEADSHRHLVEEADTDAASSRLLELGQQVRALAQEVGANAMGDQLLARHQTHSRHKQRHTRHSRHHRAREHKHTAGERFRQVYQEAATEQDSWVPEGEVDVPRFSEAVRAVPVQSSAPPPAQQQPVTAQQTTPAQQQPVTGQPPPERSTPVTGTPQSTPVGPGKPLGESLAKQAQAAATARMQAEAQAKAQTQAMQLAQAQTQPTKVTPKAPPAGNSTDTLSSLKAQIPAGVTPVEHLVAKNESNAGKDVGAPDESPQPSYMPSQPKRNVSCPNGCNNQGYCTVQGTCLCKPLFSGADCSVRKCLPECGEHGTCQTETGECVCKPGFCGFACSKRCCPYNCNDRGFCDRQVCRCQTGFEGLYCQDLKGCPGKCNPPHGECRNSTCFCADGWTGPGCELKICPGLPNTCNSNGRCDAKAGLCHCDTGYFGDACELKKCPNDCSGMGECQTHTGKCKCNPGFYGDDCAPSNCKNKCSQHGVCKYNNQSAHGYCECEKGWTGDGCEVELCPQGCGAQGKQGVCTTTGCLCHANYTGAGCSIRQCPLKCTSPLHGLCDNVTWACSCLKGWTGDGCESAICKESCNFRGVCNNGTCECNDWWTGPTCATPQCKKDDKGQPCNNHGRCILPEIDSTPAQALERALSNSANPQAQANAALQRSMKDEDRARCMCDSGWGGTDCSVKQCPSDCSGKGLCISGTCYCKKNYYGHDCSLSQQDMMNGGKNVSAGPLDACLKTCKHGKCMLVKKHSPSILTSEEREAQSKATAANATKGSIPQPEFVFECYCEDGWAGPHCTKSLTSCDPRCLGADGICRTDCTPQQASATVCPVSYDLPCGGPTRGACDSSSGVCHCTHGFRGPACQIALCPRGCSGRGLCNTKEHKCLCYAGWMGDGCQTRVE